MNESINIREYINMFKKRSKIIVIIMISCITIGELIAFKINSSYIPIYKASTRIRVNTLKTVPNVGYYPDLASENQEIVNTYLDLSKSKSALKEVASIVENDITPESISGMYTLTPDENNSEFVNITATHSNPEIALAIANAVPTAFNNELIKTIRLDCIEVIDEAILPQSPIPHVKTTMWTKEVIGGIVLSIFVVLLMEFLNNKIVTPKDVEEYWQLPLIGVVPYIKEKKKIIGIRMKLKNNRNKDKIKKLKEKETIYMQAKYEYGDYSLVEAFKNMRTNLSINTDIKTIVVTSSEMNEGKTTTVSNLAKCFSDLENKKVLLIDCDLRNPSIHRYFNLENNKGLTDVIYGEENLSNCLEYNDKLHILICGRRIKNPAEMLESDEMVNFIEAMKQRYDHIFINSPPVIRVNDACIISKYVDGTIIVSASDEVDIDLAKLSKKRLEKVNTNIIGVILNKFKESDDKFYHYYGYGDEDIENSKKSFLKNLFKKKR